MSLVSSAFIHSGHRLPARPSWPTLLVLLAVWRRRRRTRRQLSDLDARALADIGIDPSMRRRELAKWFWQA